MYLEYQSVHLTEEYVQVLRQISHSLKPNEKDALAKDYSWEEHDEIEEIIKQDRNMFLAGIVFKELKRRQEVFPCGKQYYVFILLYF